MFKRVRSRGTFKWWFLLGEGSSEEKGGRGRGGEVQREGVPRKVFSEVSFSEEERRVSGRKGIFREREVW